MILYRGITYDEYNDLRNNTTKDKPRIYINDCNSFKYVDNEYYIHFFRYLEHAKMYLSLFGEMIIKYNIPDERIVESGFGYYTYKRMVSAAIPEYIINVDDYNIECIKEINPDMKNCIKRIDGINEVKIYDNLIKELYREWFPKMGYFKQDPYEFYVYLVEYFKEIGYDNALNIYGKKMSKKRLIKRR